MNVAIVGHHVGNVEKVFLSRGHVVLALNPPEAKFYLSGVRHTDLLIAFPPCKFLCSSGLHWNTRRPERAKDTDAAVEFVAWLMNLPIPRICVENPVGCLSSRIRRPEQIIQPYQFGHDVSKKTCLWLKHLPKLKSTAFIAPRFVTTAQGKTLERWANQFDSGQNNLVGAKDRALKRAERYSGIAEAMADQWGVL